MAPRPILLLAVLLALASCGSRSEPAAAPDGGRAGRDAAPSGPDADEGYWPPVDSGWTGAPDSGSIAPPDAGTAGADASTSTADAGPTLPTVCPAAAQTYDRNFTAEGFCEASAHVVCDRYRNCCLLADASYDLCLARQEAICDEHDLMARVRAGLMTLNLTLARSCLDSESKRLTCSGDFATPECSASRLFAAATPAGGTCVEGYDCLDGRCARAIGTCGGKCAAWLGIGETCNPIDLACDPAVARCVYASTKTDQGTCTAYVATGGTCKSDGECAPRDFCSKASGATTGTCRAIPLAGAPCAPGDDCPPGYSCSGVCSKRNSVAVGGSCSSTSTCASGAYCRGATATSFGTCVATLPLGGACASYVECGLDANCTGGLCTAKQGAGGTCANDYDCKYGLLCDASAKACKPRADEGAACAGDGDCKLYLRCASGRCTMARIPLGQPCTSSVQCEQGYCPAKATPAVCTALVPDGLACEDDVSACASGYCEHRRGTSGGLCRPDCL